MSSGYQGTQLPLADGEELDTFAGSMEGVNIGDMAALSEQIMPSPGIVGLKNSLEQPARTDTVKGKKPAWLVKKESAAAARARKSDKNQKNSGSAPEVQSMAKQRANSLARMNAQLSSAVMSSIPRDADQVSGKNQAIDTVSAHTESLSEDVSELKGSLERALSRVAEVEAGQSMMTETLVNLSQKVLDLDGMLRQTGALSAIQSAQIQQGPPVKATEPAPLISEGKTNTTDRVVTAPKLSVGGSSGHPLAGASTRKPKRLD
jgi:uncharacterized protein YoxC